MGGWVQIVQRWVDGRRLGTKKVYRGHLFTTHGAFHVFKQDPDTLPRTEVGGWMDGWVGGCIASVQCCREAGYSVQRIQGCGVIAGCLRVFTQDPNTLTDAHRGGWGSGGRLMIEHTEGGGGL